MEKILKEIHFLLTHSYELELRKISLYNINMKLAGINSIQHKYATSRN